MISAETVASKRSKDEIHSENILVESNRDLEKEKERKDSIDDEFMVKFIGPETSRRRSDSSSSSSASESSFIVFDLESCAQEKLECNDKLMEDNSMGLKAEAGDNKVTQEQLKCNDKLMEVNRLDLKEEDAGDDKMIDRDYVGECFAAKKHFDDKIETDSSIQKENRFISPSAEENQIKKLTELLEKWINAGNNLVDKIVEMQKKTQLQENLNLENHNRFPKFDEKKKEYEVIREENNTSDLNVPTFTKRNITAKKEPIINYATSQKQLEEIDKIKNMPAERLKQHYLNFCQSRFKIQTSSAKLDADRKKMVENNCCKYEKKKILENVKTGKIGKKSVGFKTVKCNKRKEERNEIIPLVIIIIIIIIIIIVL